MNVREMRLFAKSLVRDAQMLDAHLLRWMNLAYRELSRSVIIPKLNAGDPVELILETDSTQRYFLPYDFCRTIAFFDSTGRSLDVLPSEDVRQFNEYGALGSFVAFYEHQSVNVTPVVDSGSTPDTIAILNRGTTVTCSDTVFTDEHIGEWILPLARNTNATAGNPEDYAYLISDTAGTVAVPSATCTIARPFRGVLTDSGLVTDLSTSYFEVRPKNTPSIRIWGPAASNTDYSVSIEYQRVPSKLANDEDIPEEPRFCEAIVYRAIQMAGWAYRETFMVKTAAEIIAQALGSFQTCKDFDKNLIHNFLTANPNSRSYSQVAGMRMGMGHAYSHGGIRY